MLSKPSWFILKVTWKTDVLGWIWAHKLSFRVIRHGILMKQGASLLYLCSATKKLNNFSADLSDVPGQPP